MAAFQNVGQIEAYHLIHGQDNSTLASERDLVDIRTFLVA